MKINADLSERVVIDTNQVDWTETRLPGVHRRVLDRDGAEAGRATTIVRFDKNSYFDPHEHPGGEEFLVLEGVFSDQYGDFPAGTYVRNPVGSAHKPHTAEGCTIFVKLWQMEPEDQEFVRVNTDSATWHPGMVEGLTVMPLHQFETEHVALVRWAPGTVFTQHRHFGGEEILVLDGVFEDEFGRYPEGTWIRSPHGSVHAPLSTDGCTILVKTGHLAEQVEPTVTGSAYVAR